MTAPVEIKIYEPDGTTLIGAGAVPRRDDVSAKDELNGIGSGALSLHLDDAFLASNPSLLDDFNIVKVRPLTETDPVYAWQIEDVAPTQVSSQEKAGRTVAVSGRHVRSLLERGVVIGTGEHRTFDFSSPDLPGYPTDWDTPVGVQQGSDPTARGGAPAGWTEPTAEWIWSTDPTTTAPAEVNWFRAEFTLAVETDVTLWASCDNSMSLQLNGNLVASTDITDWFAWRNIVTYHEVLPAGTYTVAARVVNAAQTLGNPGAFLCVVGIADDQGKPDPDEVILRTNETDWLVHPATDPPGWHAAQILITCMEEAQAAGELSSAITWDFDGDLDSDGAAWDDIRDVQIPVGEDLLTLSNRWAGTVYDIHMTPGLVLQAWKRRGADLTGVPVALTAVTSLAPTKRGGAVRNVVRFLHDGIWYEVVDAVSVALPGVGRRPVILSFGDAGTVEEKTQLATEALVDLADPQITLPLSMTSAVGPQPCADFNLGDTISAPAWLTGTGDARVLTWTLAEAENRIDWTLDLYPET